MKCSKDPIRLKCLDNIKITIWDKREETTNSTIDQEEVEEAVEEEVKVVVVTTRVRTNRISSSIISRRGNSKMQPTKLLTSLNNSQLQELLLHS